MSPSVGEVRWGWGLGDEESLSHMQLGWKMCISQNGLGFDAETNFKNLNGLKQCLFLTYTSISVTDWEGCSLSHPGPRLVEMPSQHVLPQPQKHEKGQTYTASYSCRPEVYLWLFSPVSLALGSHMAQLPQRELGRYNLIPCAEREVECLGTGPMSSTRKLDAILIRERQQVALPYIFCLQRRAQALSTCCHVGLASRFFNEEGSELISETLYFSLHIN